jgi:hypothetical protein
MRESWKPIATAPRDREIELRSTYVPSAEAARNGSRQREQYGTGRWLYDSKNGPVFSGMQGHYPHSWRDLKEDHRA